MATWTFTAWFAVFLLSLVGAAVCGQERTVWKTGIEFQRQMESPVSVNWKENPLREGLNRLAQVHGTAIFLDRRIDPDQRVDFSCTDEPLQLAIARLCGEIGTATCSLGSVIYVGPTETAERLATVAALRRQEAGKFSNVAKARWLKQQPLRWPLLAEPRTVLAELAQQGNFKMNNLEDVPHDVWPAVDLPSVPLADRLSLLVAGFGMTYRFDSTGAMVALEPIPAQATYEHTYGARGDIDKTLGELTRMFPETRVERRGSQFFVAGRFEDHEKIGRLLRGERVKTIQSAPSEKRYSLKVENQPAGAVIKTIAKQLGKEMKYAPEALEGLKTSVSFSVTEVPLEELLRTTLAPLQLSWTVTDEAIEIAPAK